MTDRYNEAAYYPTEDPARMGPGYNVFNAIPYLREFSLSRPRVIYQPPTISELQAAGALPVGQLSELNSKLPTITLSVEIGPCRSNCKEVPVSSTSVGFLRPPEWEGLEAATEKLRQCGAVTSEQEYWSEEYWASVQTLGSKSGDSFACSSIPTKASEPELITVASGSFSDQRRHKMSRRDSVYSVTGRRGNDCGGFYFFRRSQRSLYGNSESFFSKWQVSNSPQSLCQTETSLREGRRVRLGPQLVLGSSPKSRSAAVAAGVKGKLLQRRKAARQGTLSERTEALVAAPKSKGGGYSEGKGYLAAEHTVLVPSVMSINHFLGFDTRKVSGLELKAVNVAGEGVARNKMGAEPTGTKKFVGSLKAKGSQFKGPLPLNTRANLSASSSEVCALEEDLRTHSLSVITLCSDIYRDPNSSQKPLPDIMEESNTTVVLQTSGPLASVEFVHAENRQDASPDLKQTDVDRFVVPDAGSGSVVKPTLVGLELRPDRELSKRCCTVM